VIEAILSAEVVLLAPSNPITSIGPILAVPGVRDALQKTKGRIAAISPIVGTKRCRTCRNPECLAGIAGFNHGCG